MKMRKWGAIASIAVISGAALLGAIACGGSAATTGAASPTAAEKTTAQSWADILGHEPTGVAATVLQRGQMTVANDANYPPFSSLNDQGQMVGYDVDVANRVAELLKVDLKQVQVGWDTIPTGLKAHRFDVSIGTMTPTKERMQSMDFTAPYLYSTQQLIILKSSPEIVTPNGLRGKKIACSAQTTSYYFMQKLGGVKIKTYGTDLDALPDIKNGRIDGLVTSGPTAIGVVASGEPFRFSGKPLFYEADAFAIAKGETDWLALLNWAVGTMHNDGSLKAISEKNIGGLDLASKPPAGSVVIGLNP